MNLPTPNRSRRSFIRNAGTLSLGALGGMKLVPVIAGTTGSLPAASGSLAGERATGLPIAVISDPHIHDVYAETDTLRENFPRNPLTGKTATIHRMERQLSISRLENECGFALKTALDDVLSRGIRHVIIPGDFTSEGTMMNIRATQRILGRYARDHGLRFYLTCGNHDPRFPYATDGGFTNLLGADGRQQPVMSREGLHTDDDGRALPTLIDANLRYGGYREIISTFEDHGFRPRKSDIHWETPFSRYGLDDYTYARAREASRIENRTYPIGPDSIPVPDASYLVEPLEGLWLLSIDANVYLPTGDAPSGDGGHPRFRPSGGAGYNQVARHKPFLVDWMKSVARRASAHGKTLISFSHYPLLEYCEGATPDIQRLLDRPHLITVPDPEVSRTFADTGIGLHFGGHIHTNGTARMTTPDGHFLVDIQVPSTAAYPPEYKIVTAHGRRRFEIETVPIDGVDRLTEFFELYQMEHAQLRESGISTIWDRAILELTDYRAFTTAHLRELVFRYRHFPFRWPADLATLLSRVNGKDLLELSQWTVNKLSPVAFAQWRGEDLVFDFYRLYHGRELALKDIGEQRIAQYRSLNKAFAQVDSKRTEDATKKQLARFIRIINTLLDGTPSRHILVDLDAMRIRDLS